MGLRTMGAAGKDEPALGRALDIFAGCPNRVEVSAFLVTWAVEHKLRGFALGAGTALVGALALYLYLRSKGKKLP